MNSRPRISNTPLLAARLVAIAALGALSACQTATSPSHHHTAASSNRGTSAHRVAMSPLVGKNDAACCESYAVELNDKLHAAGVQSRVLKMYLTQAHQARTHVAVLYSEAGQNYIVDNQVFAPVRVSNAHDDMYRARQFYVQAVGGNPFDVLYVN